MNLYQITTNNPLQTNLIAAKSLDDVFVRLEGKGVLQIRTVDVASIDKIVDIFSKKPIKPPTEPIKPIEPKKKLTNQQNINYLKVIKDQVGDCRLSTAIKRLNT